MSQTKPRTKTCPHCGSSPEGSPPMVSRYTQTRSNTYGVSQSLSGDDLLDYLGFDKIPRDIESPVVPEIAEMPRSSASLAPKEERMYSRFLARRTPSVKRKSTLGALRSRVSESQNKNVDSRVQPASNLGKALGKSNSVKPSQNPEPEIPVTERFRSYRTNIRASMRRKQNVVETEAPGIMTPTAQESLRTYHAFTIRKTRVNNLNGEKASWARAETVTHSFSEDEVSKKIRNLSKTNRSITDKQASLSHLQRGQIKKLLADLETKEGGEGGEWTLCQLERRVNRFSFTEIDEGESITVYLRRTPGKEASPAAVTKHPDIKPLRHSDRSIEKVIDSKRNAATEESPEKTKLKYKSKAPPRLNISRKPAQGLGIAGLPPGVTSSYPKNVLDGLVLGDKSVAKDDTATVSSYTPSIGSNVRFRDDVSISTCSNGRRKAVLNQFSPINAWLPSFSQPVAGKQYGPNMQLRPISRAYEIQTETLGLSKRGAIC